MSDLPTGTVTFLFTDIEGSTRLWEEHPEAMAKALARHDALLRTAVKSHHGHVFKTIGDAFCAAFATASDALDAALETQQSLRSSPPSTAKTSAAPLLKVRTALHTGAAEQRAGDYFGPALNRVSRLLSAGHGGQVLISQATADLVRDTLPRGVNLRDLGVHRLRDLTRSEAIFQLLHPDVPADFPPLRSLQAFAHNLPVQLTSFVGRERELAEVKRLLITTRLLTFTGTGGVGKTRLALQIAADLFEEYPDGVWLVELAPLMDPALLPLAVAAALGVREEPNRPLLATLSDHLRPKKLLLLLDNSEHLLSGCAQVADTLLRNCPQVQVLASSREALGIAGELTWRVPSLPVPNPQRLPAARAELPAALLQYEAVRLFSERAAFSQPGFGVTSENAMAVAEVCQRLDGIPLAIELAAVRLNVLSVEQVAARLGDRFRLLTGGSRAALPRQQTLRATLDWSYDLLSEAERVLFRRLSVFAGGWTLEAAEVVCADPEDSRQRAEHRGERPQRPAADGFLPADVLELLTALVEKSLVLYEGADERYRLLETVRQYAGDRLVESGEAGAVRRRHLDFFVRWSEQAEATSTGGEADLWLERLDSERENLRAALEWSLASEEGGESALRLAAAVRRLWIARDYFQEGRIWLERVLKVAAGASSLLRGELLATAAWIALRQDDYTAARAWGEESAAIWRQMEDKGRLAGVLHVLGSVACQECDHARARAIFEEGLALEQGAGIGGRIAESLNELGMIALRQGDLVAARSLFEGALAAARKLRDAGRLAGSLLNLGHVARTEGNYIEARARYEDCLAAGRERRYPWITTYALADLGLVLLKQKEYAAAQARIEESLRIWWEMKNPFGVIRGLEGLAQLAWACRQPGRAARLFGAAEGQREVIHAPLPPVDRADYDCVPAIRAAMGEEAFASAWAEGRAMTLEEAIAYALEEDAAG